MNLTSLLVFLGIGAIAGRLAGQFLKGGGYGLLGNIVIGIVGSVVGGYVFGLFGIAAGGLIGAILLLYIVGQIKRAS